MNDQDNNIAQLRRELSSARMRLDDQKKHIADLESELSGRNEQINKLERDLSDGREHAARLEQNVAAYIHSSSWKVTAPLRRLKSARINIHGVFRSALQYLYWTVTLQIGRRLRARAAAKIIQPSGLFDGPYYLERYSDVADSGMDPLLHFVLAGADERRDPNPLFDTAFYCDANPEVAKSRSNPLIHYIRSGASEGRNPHPLFHTAFYTQHNSDVPLSGINPLSHYLSFGHQVGRDPNPLFSGSYYIGSNDYGVKSDANPLIHYLLDGAAAGINPHPQFHTSYYTRKYLSAKSNDVNPLAHFFLQGAAKGFHTRFQITDNDVNQALARVRLHKLSVSVIVPTWNRSPIILRALNSVMAQSYPAIQIIISDDGSTDGTESLVRETFADAIDGRLIEYVNSGHRGVSAARNAALRLARGDLIAYLDSDNEWNPHYLLFMVACFVDHPRIDSVYSGLKLINQLKQRDFVRTVPYSRKRLLLYNFIDINIFIHRRELFDRLGGFDEQLTRLVDWELVIRYTENKPPYFLPIALAQYYVSQGLKTITLTEDMHANWYKIMQRHNREAKTYGVPFFSHESTKDGVIVADQGDESEAAVELSCNICGSTKFTFGPGHQKSRIGNLPQCVQCHSLERHRIFRKVFQKIIGDEFKSFRALQFSSDLGVDPGWFRHHEISIYGGDNSLDLQRIDRADCSYSVIICNHVLEHVSDDQAAVRELLRVVTEDGFVCITVPNPIELAHTRDWGHADDENHGHYRVYGADVTRIFRIASGGAYIYGFKDIDPVTGTEDIIYFLTRSLFRMHRIIARLSDKRPRLYFYPDYRKTNPYQRLLYQHSDNILEVSPNNIEACITQLERKDGPGPTIFHIHWTSSITGESGSPEHAERDALTFIHNLDRFVRLGGRLVWTVHNEAPHGSPWPELEVILRKGIIEHASAIHIHSPHVKELVSGSYEIPEEKTVVARHGSYVGVYPNTIDRNAARHRLGLATDDFVFLFVGQLRGDKGIDRLIAAFEQISADKDTFKLVVAGDPVDFDTSQLEARAKSNGNIDLVLRVIGDDELQYYLNSADFVVLPYSKVLTSGAAMLAMSFGIPVIAPRIGLISEMIQDDVHGYLYDGGDPQGLNNAITKAGAASLEVTESMRKACREFAAACDWRSTWDDLLPRLLSIIYGTSVNLSVGGIARQCVISRPPMDNDRVAIVVVCHDTATANDAINCISSLVAQSYGEVEIYVVSNDVDMATYVHLNQTFPQCVVIQAPDNLGYAGGNNIALEMIRERRYEYVWILNPDTIVPEETLEQLVRIADRRPDVSIFGSKIYYGETRKRVWFAGGEIDWSNGLGTSHLYMGQPGGDVPADPIDVDYVTGASIFFRKKLLDDVGLIPEEYFAYFEETDWCLKASGMGHKITVFPETELFHLKRSENGGVPTLFYLYYFVRGLLLMCRKYHPDMMEATLNRQESVTNAWLANIASVKPEFKDTARKAIDQAIRDGLDGVVGWKAL